MMFSFVISVLVSSFLLFQIQPLLAKYILPWFGGTSGVWSASLLFFQGFLTVGYGYAHWLTTRLSRRLQGQIHLAFLGISIVLLAVNAINWESPILPGLSRHPSDVFNPIIDVIQSLFIAVGIPYCLLSSNSTIMQDWFLLKNRNRSPYPLYAVSNAGSLVGLISYPFFIEPLLRVVDQSYIWIGGYLLFILVTGHHAWTVQGWESPTKAILSKGEKVDRQKSNLKRNFSWLFLSGLASMLLLATTNQITQEVASIPLLWVLPFSVYLISFVLAFSNGFLYRRLIFVGFLLLCTILFVWFLELSTSSIYYQIAVYLALLFVCTMICLGELYQRRPNTDSITQFYLMISIGGAMGGIAVNMLFPRIFTGLWEHQLGVGLVWILVFYLLNNQPVSNRYYVNQSLTAIVGLATIVVFATLYFKMDSYEKGARISSRNFFGTLRVIELSENDPENHRNLFMHGITTHGTQFVSREKRLIPTAYYGEKSGIGITFNNYPTRPKPLRVGLIGLGAGVLASYGQEGDQFWFYEINPEVLEIAQSEFFTFLKDTPADVEITLGDGRVILEREFEDYGSMQFDLLVLDAFNSGSIPTHLLTIEAISLYINHLKPDGLLAIHISNRFLNLAPVIWQLADTVGIDGTTFFDTTKNDFIAPSRWLILTNNQEFLSNSEVQRWEIENENYKYSQRLWTDDYSNLITVFK